MSPPSNRLLTILLVGALIFLVLKIILKMAVIIALAVVLGILALPALGMIGRGQKRP